MGLRDNFRQAARELMGTEAEAPAREPAEYPEDGSQEERGGYRTEEPADEGGAPTEPPIELPPAPERTYIAAGAHIEGNMTAEGGVELDGSIKGSLTSRSALLVRGVLDGDGAGDSIRVLGGRVNGNLKAMGAVSVDSASVIIGDIGAQSLELDGKVKGDLAVEQTESVFIECDSMLPLAGELHKRNFQLEIDDFGTGYASLNLLGMVAADVLKIDRCLLADFKTNPRGRTILRKAIEMGRETEMRTICEGVETEAQLQYLRQIGCDMGQGFYFFRPMPAAQFEQTILRSGNNISHKAVAIV